MILKMQNNVFFLWLYCGYFQEKYSLGSNQCNEKRNFAIIPFLVIYALTFHILEHKRFYNRGWVWEMCCTPAKQMKISPWEVLRHRLKVFLMGKLVCWTTKSINEESQTQVMLSALAWSPLAEVHGACYWCAVQKAFQQINNHFISSFPDPSILLLNSLKLIFHQTCLKDEWNYMSQCCMFVHQMGKPICYPH